MARVQYGTTITEIKGKIQGQVLQGGNVGFVIRNKGYTKGIASNQRAAANNVLSLNATRWRTLTDLQRTAWNNLAPDWLFYNRFGAAYQGSGFQIFNSYNGYRYTIDGVLVLSPGSPSAPPALGPSTLSYDLSGDFMWSDSNSGDADDFVSFYAAPPASAGRNANYARFKLLMCVPSDGSPDYDLKTAYQAMYGVPAVGQRVIIKQVSLRQSFPYPYYPTILSTLVVA